MNETLLQCSSEPEVQIVILSCDRPEYCKQAVKSAIAQKYSKCLIQVSDNSQNELVADMLKDAFPSVDVIRRRPQLPPLEHFNLLIAEAQSELLVLFHDDDILEPDYAEIMVRQFTDHPDISAVACNARILNKDSITKWSFMGKVEPYKQIYQLDDLIRSYIKLDTNAPAPFPSYMYRSIAIKGLKLNFDSGGKHSDVSFLTDVLEKGPMIWLGKCLIQYRFHGKNDSSTENIPHRLKLLHHLMKKGAIKRGSLLHMDFRLNYCFNWLRQNSDGYLWPKCKWVKQDRRVKIIRHFVLLSLIRMSLTRRDFWGRFVRIVMKNIRR